MTRLTAFCDLTFCPVSYDFVTWLARAMKARDEAGCEGLHVVIVPMENGLGGFSRPWGKHDEAATRWRLWHILVAAVPLARATLTLAATRADAVAMDSCLRNPRWWPEGKAHFMGPLVDAARRGERIPLLEATAAARRFVGDWLAGRDERPVVTLTLRRQTTDPDRNTNAAAWDGMARWLEVEGMRPIVLDDANDALSAGRGFAESDPDLRLALYERAKMNLIGNNGPQELLKFSCAPYLAFGQALTAGWQDHFRRYFHLASGEQLPWARAGQRLVYRRDDLAVLKEEFTKAAWATQAA